MAMLLYLFVQEAMYGQRDNLCVSCLLALTFDLGGASTTARIEAGEMDGGG
jgi:hypothetical protein